jgi:hypothetical protein
MFKLLEKAFRRLPNILQNFIWICLFGFVSYLIFLIYSKLGESILPWMNQRKFVIVQSIGSVATAIAVSITLMDINNRYQFEQKKFHFESDPYISIVPIITNPVNILVDNQVAQFNKCLLTQSDFKFNLINNGNGIAGNVDVFISSDNLFETDTTICDKIFNFTPKESTSITTAHLYKKQNIKIDWKNNFFVKIIYKSNYSSIRIFEDLYKIEVKKVVVIRHIVDQSAQSEVQPLFEQTNTLNQTEVTVKLEQIEHSYIHNIIPIKLSKR